MKRVHLVELEDLPWVPAAIRDGGTDLLDFFFGKLRFYGPAVDAVATALDASGGTQLVDLCSGGGGGALFVLRELRARGRGEVEALLTDRHPNDAARARVAGLEGVRYHPEPIDAAQVPTSLPGLRTMFGALHHFRPEEVKTLLAGAVASRTHLAFVDVAANSVVRRMPTPLVPLASVPNVLVLLLLPLLLVPFVRPVRLSRVVFTYVVPLIPLLFAWDGTVSAFRAYTPDELLEIARSVPGADGYVWEAGQAGKALYLCGRPAQQTAAGAAT